MKNLKSFVVVLVLVLVGVMVSATSVVAQSPPTPNRVPSGWLDIVSWQIFGGWAVDFDSPSMSVDVNITSETNGKIKQVALLNASGERPDVNDYFGIEGLHGFGMLTPDSLCDGIAHLIHAYAVDAQTGEYSELNGSPKQLLCGSPKPAGTINGQMTDDSGQPLTTAGNQARVNLYHVLKSGEAVWVNQTNFSQGVDQNGKFVFATDSNDDPLVVDEMYETVASARDHIYGRLRFTLIAGENTAVHQLKIAPLVIYNYGPAAPIAPVDGQLQVPVLVCNNGGYTGGDFFQANITMSGPGKTSEYIQVPSTWWLYVPTEGWCFYHIITAAVDTDLPNGYNYCAQIKIGLINEPEEIYSETGSCALKGVRQSR